MRRLTFAVFFSLTAAAFGAEPRVIAVFPDLDAGLKSAEHTDHRGTTTAPNDFTRDVAYPTLEIHLPDRGDATRAGPATPAIVICPGGAYAGVAMDKEGRATADFLAAHGIAGLILKYRMPRPEVTGDGDPLPLLDARESLRLAHAHAKEWNIDADKIGIMGFSAGGHLASTVITHPEPAADSRDASATRGSSPAFAVLVYPVITLHDPLAHKGSRTNLLGKSPDPKLVDFYSNDQQVTDQTPPTFLVHSAADPGVPCENSLLFFAACRAHHVPAELHLFATGPHGFGLGTPGSEVAQWPDLLLSWLRARQVLPGARPAK